jgi:hypothetical protein
MPYLPNDPVVISSGNTKLGKIPNVSLPPVISCPRDTPCAKEGCYSLKAYRLYPSVRDARQHNWKILNTDMNQYFQDIENWLEANQPPYFRYHVDGDIPTDEYFDHMCELAEKFPQTHFLAFTKRRGLDIDKCPPNLAIHYSMWPGWGDPETDTPRAWLKDSREDRIEEAHFYCLKYTTDHINTCDECYACWHIDEVGRDVVFPKH